LGVDAQVPSCVHGVLVVDKPRGPTSHDVVAKVRRALGTREVGHAGTLDPMATGVLVVAIGEGTKLVRWLTADDKVYRASVALGAETDTLDAEGAIVERAPVPELVPERVHRALASFRGTIVQRPPAFSAIKVAGRALHERARRGEVVDVPEREVTVRRLELVELAEDRLELELEVSKGFYVRSLARDLARALGTRGHLAALRRLRSGPFTLEGALEGEVLDRAAARDERARREVAASVRSLADACAAMPRVILVGRGVDDARHGRPIRREHARGAEALAPGAEPIALMDEAGELVAIGAARGPRLHVIRGLRA
ncbi:MAG TPA: tRNA pseudouridine(55) synthase TruB, partial [Sandaracinaceae bacterium]